jgi:WD40 repeat protein
LVSFHQPDRSALGTGAAGTAAKPTSTVRSVAGGRKTGVIVGIVVVLALVGGIGAVILVGDDEHGRRPDQVIAQEQGSTRSANNVVWSEDGSTLYVAGETGIDSYSGSPLARTGQMETSLFPASPVWSPDHSKAVLIDLDGNSEVWDLETGEVLPGLDGPVSRLVAWSPDGEQVATTDDAGGRMVIYDVATGQESSSFVIDDGGLGRIGLVWVTPDRLVTVDGNLATTVDPTTGETVWSHHTDPDGLLAASPDGSEVVIGMNDDDHEVYDVETGEVVGAVETESRWLKSARWSPDSRWVLAAGDDEVPTLWDADAAETGSEHAGVAPYGNGGAWSPDSRRVAVPDNYDQRILIIDPAGEVDDEELSIAEDEVLYASAWSPEGDRLAAVSGLGTIFVWDVST